MYTSPTDGDEGEANNVRLERIPFERILSVSFFRNCSFLPRGTDEWDIGSSVISSFLSHTLLVSGLNNTQLGGPTIASCGNFKCLEV